MDLHPELVAHRGQEVRQPLPERHPRGQLGSVGGHDRGREEVGGVGGLVPVEAEAPEGGHYEMRGK